MGTRAWVLGGFLVGATGCTVVVAGDDAQCQSVSDCEARGFDGAVCIDGACVEDPVWSCLGRVEEPTPDPSQRVEVSFRLATATGNAITDAVVDVCAKLDINCTDPDSPDFPKGLDTDADGILTASVRQGFDGFMRVTGPELMESRVYVGRPIIDSIPVDEVRLLRRDAYEQLAGAIAGRPPDPTRGTVIALVIDCRADGAAGVRFETANADEEADSFYLINQFPLADAEETDADGFGGFFNVLTGPAVVRAIRHADDVTIGESSLQIFADTISYVLVAPTP